MTFEGAFFDQTSGTLNLVDLASTLFKNTGAFNWVGGTLAGDVLPGARASRVRKGRHSVLSVLTVRS